jgi:hypothetical protein
LLRRLAAEPLLQFLCAGAALLAAQHLVAPAGAEASSPDQITVPQRVVASMQAAFVQEKKRTPTEAEIREMVNKHVEGEVLYREALRYGLDRSDVIVRREMQRKMRFLIEDTTPLPEPGHEELQAWLDEHADQYARPQRISFEQVFLSRAKHGKDLEYNAGRALAELRTDPNAFRRLSDPFPAGLVIRDADPAYIEKHFGYGMAPALLALAEGEWSQPLRSSLGVHVVRVTQRVAPAPVTVEQAGQRLITDYREAQRAAANRRALEKLRARYQIVIEAAS